MNRLCRWLVCAFLCLFGCVSAACAQTTSLMDEALYYHYTPEGLQFSDNSYEKTDGLLAFEIDDDKTNWSSAIAWTGEDNVSIVIGLKAPQGVNVGDWVMLKSGKNEAEALKFIENAEKEINKINKLRANHYKYYTDKEWQDFDNYDICINSDALGVEKAADLICQMVVTG